MHKTHSFDQKNNEKFFFTVTGNKQFLFLGLMQPGPCGYIWQDEDLVPE